MGRTDTLDPSCATPPAAREPTEVGLGSGRIPTGRSIRSTIPHRPPTVGRAEVVWPAGGCCGVFGLHQHVLLPSRHRQLGFAYDPCPSALAGTAEKAVRPYYECQGLTNPPSVDHLTVLTSLGNGPGICAGSHHIPMSHPTSFVVRFPFHGVGGELVRKIRPLFPLKRVREFATVGWAPRQAIGAGSFRRREVFCACGSMKWSFGKYWMGSSLVFTRTPIVIAP